MTVAGILIKGAKSKNVPLLQNGSKNSNPECEELPTKLSKRLLEMVYYLLLLVLLLALVCNFALIIHDLFHMNMITEIETSVAEQEILFRKMKIINRKLELSLINAETKELYEKGKTSTQWSLTNECANIRNAEKFNCFPRGSANESACTDRGCCWSPMSTSGNDHVAKELDVPWCYYPKDFQTYEQINRTVVNHVTTAFMKIVRKSPYPNDVPVLKMVITPETNNRVHIVLMDATKKSFETPYPETPVMHECISESELNYEVAIEDDGPGFTVKRKLDGQTLFDSRGTGFIFSSQMIQISSKLPSSYIYGLGEHRNDFLLNIDWNRITLMNHDSIPTDGINGYGAHPFFLNIADGGNSSGVFLKNSHPMEIILQPAPAITYRVLGGVLDFYFFLGPSPKDVIVQYTDVIGRPFMPPYWSLGFHMCKYGQSSLQVTMDTLNRTREAGIPVDVQWNDLDYMDNNNDFTWDKKDFAHLPEFVKYLHENGMHYIPILDPGVSAGEPKGSYPPYDDGVAAGIFIKNETGHPLVGKVWNKKSTVWPDFTNPDTVEYWTKQLKNLHDEIEFDGLWIDMNEPSNFVDGSLDGCPNTNWEYPPYVPTVQGGHLNYKTVCMSAGHYLGKHYQVHNLHGFTEAIASNFALSEIRDKRPFIISRSTFAGQGKFSGHWTGDVMSSWDDMKHTVGDILSFNLFGIPMVGADICGFNGNTTAALCKRWLQLGAFYPFSRTHNSDDTIDQDPVSMGPDVVLSTERVLKIRYSLLPYLYSLFWRAHTFGETVARPLFFEFPEDEKTYNISTQFLWGPAFQIIPVLKEDATFVEAYLPGEFWYNLYTMKRVEGGDVALSVSSKDIPLFIRPKSIIPFQEPGMTTTESRKNPFSLCVALDSQGMAEGFLYWDDGVSLNNFNEANLIHFSASNNSVSSSVEYFKYDTPMPLQFIIVVGVTSPVKTVNVNGQNTEFLYNNSSQTLTVPLSCSFKDNFTVSWSF